MPRKYCAVVWHAVSRKKGATVAIIAFIAVIGGFAAYSGMPSEEEPEPVPVLTTIERDSEPENDSTSIAENVEEQPQQDNGTSPNVAAFASDVYVVWSQGGEIFVAASSNGDPFGDAESISSNEGFWPNVAAAENSYVTWTEDFDIMIGVQ
jgi:hypothetical protein